MKLAYLLLFLMMAYIVSRMSRAYTDMAVELREMRIKCMGGNAAATQAKKSESTTLPLFRDMGAVASTLKGLADKFT
jgi:hypothetical protein